MSVRPARMITATAIAAITLVLLSLTRGANAAPGDPIPDPNITPAPGDPATVSQFAQPTWQTNGIVWAMEYVNGVVYIGGNFTKVRPPNARVGQREVDRKNMAAFDAQTGELLPFQHSFTAKTYSYDPATQRPDKSCTVDWQAHTYTCDTVYEIRRSPGGGSIYVGGDFTKIDGIDRSKLAAFSTANARTVNNPLNNSFKPLGLDRRVRSLAIGDAAVYVGGIFTTAAGQPRSKLAAFNRANGALLPWAPQVVGPGSNGGVLAMTMSPDNTRVILGGEFDSINGSGRHGLDAVDAVSGASTLWEFTGIPLRSFVTDLVIDDDSVYAAAEGLGTFDGRVALNPTNGQARWIDYCKGATWSLAIIDNVLYSGSHAHDCSQTIGGFPEIATGTDPKWQRLLAQTADQNSTRILRWFPNTNGGDYSLPADQTPARLGPRTMTTDGVSLWVGGQFTVVNGVMQQSLVRFSPEPGQASSGRQRVPQEQRTQDSLDPKAIQDPQDLPPIDNGTFPGGPPPDGASVPGVDNQPAPAGNL